MRGWCAAAALLAGCSFVPGAYPLDSGPGGDAVDAMTNPNLRFTSVTATVASLHPGLYGFEVTAVLHNDLTVDVTDVHARLTFDDATANRGPDFRFRDLDRRDGVTAAQPTTVAAGAGVTYRFKVDARAFAVSPGPILVNAAGNGIANGNSVSATPLAPALELSFDAMAAPIVVNTTSDTVANDAEITLREAIVLANANPGLDRITFDPVLFPASNAGVINLDETNGALPSITAAGGGLIIDASDRGVSVAIDSGWESPAGRYGLHLTGGTLVIENVRFRNFAFNYLDENITNAGGNCGGGAMLEGGAIRVDGGTLALDNVRFVDPSVAERNCYAATVRLHGGTDHRILNSTFTDQVMDSVYVAAPMIEISNNLMNAGTNLNDVDECIFVASQGGQDLWITGNICVDQEYSAIAANGTDAGTLYIVNNTFVRNGRSSLGAIRRNGATRPIVTRNNLYVANNPQAFVADATGTGFDLAHESTTDASLCGSSCASAATANATIQLSVLPMLVNQNGSTADDLTPQGGSPLIDTGDDWIDRNGKAPRRFDGVAPDRGAIETP